MTNYYSLIKALDEEFFKLEDRYRIKRKEIDRLHQEQEASLISKEVKELAILLHKKICNSNHIDQCSFEDDNWDSYANKHYVEKAKKILKVASFSEAMKVISAL